MQRESYLKAMGIPVWQSRPKPTPASHFGVYDEADQCMAVVSAQIHNSDEKALFEKMLLAISQRVKPADIRTNTKNVIAIGVDTPSLKMMLDDPQAKKQAWAVLKPMAELCKMKP